MKFELKCLVVTFAMVIGGSLVSMPVVAQENGGTNAQCIDEDGDGWGWDGSASCQIPNFVPMAGACVDYDGDGYGWNGIASCLVSEPAACIDEDGDGWGWNGSASCLIEDFVPVAGECVDTDGDGYGWNGVASCMIGGGSTPPDEGPSDGDIAAFNSMLQGVRSYGCVPGGEGFFTTEFVEVFSDGITSNDVWLYKDQDCTSRPLTFSTQLGLERYMVEMPLSTNDGQSVYGINFQILQLSSEDTNDAFPVGTTLYDIVKLEDGGFTLGNAFATTPEERPLDLLQPAAAVSVGMRADPASAEGLMHTWGAACFNGKIQQRVFDEFNLTETVECFADDDCDIDSFYATRINTWDVTYADAVTTVFGQPALQVRSELADSRLDQIVIGAGLPSPPALSEVGIVFEDIWAVFANELVIGTCLDKSIGDCGSAGNIPNLLNFNVGNRFIRQ